MVKETKKKRESENQYTQCRKTMLRQYWSRICLSKSTIWLRPFSAWVDGGVGEGYTNHFIDMTTHFKQIQEDKFTWNPRTS